MPKRAAGFTIVELALVVMVIAILATITVANYRGIQSRAHDDSVQDDLSKYSDALNVYYSDNTKYPPDSAALTTITNVKFSKTSFLTTSNAALYCVTTTGNQNAAVIAKSVSGKSYYILNDQPVAQFTVGTFPNTASPTTNCTDAGVASATVIWVHSTAGGWISSV